jgi:hypothetical protein
MSHAVPIQPLIFHWRHDVNADVYDYDQRKATFKARCTQFYRPAVGDVTMPPNTGKYYWELITTGENLRVGVCTTNADLRGEMGRAPGLYSLTAQNGACETEGRELKRLWRLLVPVAGGTFGFCWDSDNGTLQAWFNGEFIGTMLHEKFELKGKTVSPCVGIAGIEDNNRNIGIGMKSALVNEHPRIPKVIHSL